MIIDFLRTNDSDLLTQFQSGAFALIGGVRAELFAGIRTDLHRQQVETIISVLPRQATLETVWEPLGENLATLRRNGLKLPYPDVLLATIAIELDVELWSRDNHFPLMQTVLTKLKLYQEPA